jgi:outer membrane protein assembly factor BamA
MTRSLLLILLALCAARMAAAAEPPAARGAYAIRGNEALSDEDILGALGPVPCAAADSACLKARCDSIAYLYWSLGYIDVRVTCTGGGAGGPAKVDIVEGGVSAVADVFIEGASDKGRALIEPIFAETVGRPFTPARFEAAVARALSAYDDAGYPVARITPEVTSLGEGGLGVHLTVDEGPRATIGSVRFDGAVATRHHVLVRETGLKTGEPYDGSKVLEARRSLMRLGVFEEVSEPTLSLNPADSSLVVTFRTVEARTSFLEGALAYEPTPSGNEFYGQVEVDLRNIAGTLRRAGVYWMRRGGGRSAWELRYREPRIFMLPVALEGAIDSDIDETSYERRRFSLRLAQQDGRRFEISAGWFMAKVREGPLVVEDEEGGTRNSYDENGFDLGLAYDGTDRIINPTRGLAGTLGLEFSTLKCDGCEEPDRNIWSGLAGGSFLFGIAGNTVGFLAASFRGVSAGEGSVPASHLIRVGGVQSLRGYPEEWFVTDQVLVATAEVRYIVGPRSRLFLFLDLGTIRELEGVEGEVDSPLAGYGFGLTTGSRIGVVRVEVATARGEPLGEAKLHLRLTQRF